MGIDKFLDPVTLFTIVVCTVELFSSITDVVVYAIESLSDPFKDQI